MQFLDLPSQRCGVRAKVSFRQHDNWHRTRLKCEGQIPFQAGKIEFLIARTDDEDGVDIRCNDLRFDFCSSSLAVEECLSLKPVSGAIVLCIQYQPITDSDFARRFRKLYGNTEFPSFAQYQHLASIMGRHSHDDTGILPIRRKLLLKKWSPAESTKSLVVHSDDPYKTQPRNGHRRA